jgi:hypothetical protein
MGQKEAAVMRFGKSSKLNVLLMSGNPHDSVIWGEVYNRLEKRRSVVSRVRDAYADSDAWATLAEGSVNAIFMVPLEVRFFEALRSF